MIDECMDMICWPLLTLALALALALALGLGLGLGLGLALALTLTQTLTLTCGRRGDRRVHGHDLLAALGERRGEEVWEEALDKGEDEHVT